MQVRYAVARCHWGRGNKCERLHALKLDHVELVEFLGDVPKLALTPEEVFEGAQCLLVVDLLAADEERRIMYMVGHIPGPVVEDVDGVRLKAEIVAQQVMSHAVSILTHQAVSEVP